MEQQARLFLSTRQGEKNIVYQDGFDSDCNTIINYKLRDDLAQIQSQEEIRKWIKDLKEFLKECLKNYGTVIELYIDVEGIGTVWLIPAIVKATNSIYDDNMLVAVSISLIDFDGDNYTTTRLTRY